MCNYAIFICGMLPGGGQIIVSDSHTHADLDCLLAVVPVSEFAAYFEHFFTRCYSHLGFNMEEGKDKRGHFSLLSL